MNRGPLNQPSYFLVRSDFQNTAAGWDFCRYIRGAALHAAEAATDLLVFPGQNDLVVDTASMTEAPGIEMDATNTLDFGTNPNAYHTNYFVLSETIEFIGRSLGIV